MTQRKLLTKNSSYRKLFIEFSFVFIRISSKLKLDDIK